MAIDYSNIRKFTGRPTYEISVSWRYLEKFIEDQRVDLNPDFQRGHVWTVEQQRKYIEFCIRGGMSGHTVFMNNPDRDFPTETDQTVVVDGKQRITAVLKFMRNELAVFNGGHYMKDIIGLSRLGREVTLTIGINNLKTRSEVLRWYLELNDGGVVHTQEELDRVQRLLDAETDKASVEAPQSAS